MRLSSRDRRLVSDVALSHVLHRDAFVELGYFGSACRANFRLRQLCREGFLKTVSTPYFGQFLYVAGRKAGTLCGDRIAPLLSGRTGTPSFIRHAMATTAVRIALSRKGAERWMFEQQLWRTFDGVRVRPDGMAVTAKSNLFVEVDLGNVSPKKFREKLAGYDAISPKPVCRRLYGFDSFRLIVVTTGPRRSTSLSSVLPERARFGFVVQTFDELGIALPGGWS